MIYILTFMMIFDFELPHIKYLILQATDILIICIYVCKLLAKTKFRPN